MKALMWFQVSRKNCKERTLCEMNQSLKNLGFPELSLIATIALVQNSENSNVKNLMKSGRTGRKSNYPCSNIFSSQCSNQQWKNLKDDAENLLWKY